MPTNASPEYYKAEAEYIAAQTIEEKIIKLEEVIRVAPKHKSSEKLVAQLKGRLAKLKKESETKKKKGGGKKGIKKTGNAQAIILGKENSGKSSLLSILTNAKPMISELPFTTTNPEIGTLDLDGLKVQVIEMPANADSEMFSIVHGTNLLIVLASSLNEIISWANLIKQRAIKTKKFMVLNKTDIIDENEMKKINALKDIIKISTKTGQGINELKQRIFDSLNLIRVYTKEPGKKKTEEPVVLEKNSTIKDIAKKIRNDYTKRFKNAKIWGKSAKFDGQIVGIEHKLQDKDIVELYIK